MSRAAQVAGAALGRELASISDRKGRLQDRMAALAREIADLDEEQGRVEKALDALGAFASPAPARERPAREGARVIDNVVTAIGQFGLDPWTPRQVATAAGIPLRSVAPYLTQLVAAGRIRRTARGEYRTCVAKVAS